MACIYCCDIGNATYSIAWDRYFVFEAVYIAFSVLHALLGIAALPTLSLTMSARLLMNCCCELMVFNLLLHMTTIKDIFDAYVMPYVLSILLLITHKLLLGNLRTARLGTNDAFSVMGIKINAGASTIIGYFSVLCFAMCFIRYYMNREKRYLVFAGLSVLAMLMSGTRKTVLLLLLFILLIPEFRMHNAKRMKRIIRNCVLILAGFILIMRVPFLYNMIGVRFERIFISFFGDTVVDNSTLIRNGLREKALLAFEERPLTGWGLNAFKTLFDDGRYYSHSNYLEILVGTGLVGAVIFFGRYIYLLRKMWSGIKRAVLEEYRYLLKSLLLLFVCMIVMEYWQVTYYNESMIFAYIFGLSIMRKMLLETDAGALGDDIGKFEREGSGIYENWNCNSVQ